jgi:hypothetical protein
MAVPSASAARILSERNVATAKEASTGGALPPSGAAEFLNLGEGVVFVLEKARVPYYIHQYEKVPIFGL